MLHPDILDTQDTIGALLLSQHSFKLFGLPGNCLLIKFRILDKLGGELSNCPICFFKICLGLGGLSFLLIAAPVQLSELVLLDLQLYLQLLDRGLFLAEIA